MNYKLSTAALGGFLLIAAGAAFAPPRVTLLMQNTRVNPWIAVPRLTVPQASSRRVRIEGDWMDHISSVNTVGGVSGRNITHPDGMTELILDATAGAVRGDKNISVNIACPWGSSVLGCTAGPVNVPVRVIETGPISSINPSGTVAPNTQITFNLTGEGLNVATLLPRLLHLKNATVLARTATTIRVRGTTPQCGYVDVALTDEADGDIPYRKSSALQPVLAGAICGLTLANPVGIIINCSAGTSWDATLRECR
jgi:hypothetical protein